MSYICCKCGLLAPTVRFLIVEVFVDVSNVTSTCSKLRCHTPVPRAYTASPSGLPIGTSYYTTQHNTTQHNTTQHKQAAASETHSAAISPIPNVCGTRVSAECILTKSFHAGASQKPPNPKKQLSPAAMRNAPTRSVKFLVSPCCDAHPDAEPIRTHTFLATTSAVQCNRNQH